MGVFEDNPEQAKKEAEEERESVLLSTGVEFGEAKKLIKLLNACREFYRVHKDSVDESLRAYTDSAFKEQTASLEKDCAEDFVAWKHFKSINDLDWKWRSRLGIYLFSDEIDKATMDKMLSDFRRRVKHKAEVSQIEKYLNSNSVDCFYHFTSVKNLDSIKAQGGLYSWDKADKKKINISKPGGDSLSRQLDLRYGLQDYVRLSFCTNHPMAFRLQSAGEQLCLLKVSKDIAFSILSPWRYSNTI